MKHQWLLKNDGKSCLAAAALLATAFAGGAFAQQGYPDRAIRIIVPFSAGGSSDLLGRMLAEHLGRLYKQSVVVENRPGAGGHIDGKAVTDAPADGYTLLLGSIGLHATYNTYKKLNYNPATDLQQLAAAARQHPGGMTYGSAGVGSSVHMMGELYQLNAGAPLLHVPYKGRQRGGQIDMMMFENPPTTLSYIRSGRLKALAVTGKTRLPALPDVPTAAESGYPDFVATSWTTVAVSAQVPDAVADIRQIVATPAFHQGLQEQGMTPVANTRDFAQRFIATEKTRWDQVIAKGKISAE